MLRMTRIDIDRRDALVDEIREAKERLDEAIEALNPLIEAYAGKITEAAKFAENLADWIDSYIDDRSETWQESDRGSDYAQWSEAWRGFSTYDGIDLSVSLDDDSDVVDELINLPEEPE